MRVEFYNPKTMLLARDLSDDVADKFNNSLEPNGSLDAEISIRVNSGNRSFLRGLKENSHFLILNSGQNEPDRGGVIEDSYIKDGVCYIKIVGFIEYLAKIVLYADNVFQGLDGNTLVRKKNLSHIRTFYSDKPEGVLLEILYNLESQMSSKGWNNIFWGYGNIVNHITNNPSVTWTKTYRLNSTELVTVEESIQQIFDDMDSSVFTVIPEVVNNKFRWRLNFSTSNTVKTYNAANIDIAELEIDYAEKDNKAFSMAQGTNLSGEDLVSLLPFDEDVAFSMSVVDSPAEQTKNLARINQSSIGYKKDADSQISFKTHDGSLFDLNDKVVITNTNSEVGDITILVNQIEYSEDLWFKVTGVVLNQNFTKRNAKRPNNPFNKLTKPVNYAARETRRQAFKRGDTTGWKNLD